MNKDEFLEVIRVEKRAKVRCYHSGPEVDPNSYPFLEMDLFVFEHNNKVVLIGLPNTRWAEYSPKYDIDAFDGETMTFIAESYVMDIKLL